MITAEVFMKYLNRGFSVFPVNLSVVDGKVEKKPAVPWAKYMQELATADDVSVWTSLADFNGIGMVTGAISKVLVIDIDDPNETFGFDSCVKVSSISGGKHLYYRYQSGVRNTVRVNGKPVDIRGDGGYVVIPPSGIDGKKYSWLAYDFDHMPDFPLIEKTQEIRKPPMADLPYAGKGNRNDTAIKVSGHIIAQTKKSAWETVGWSAFKDWNLTKCDPPLDEYELRNTFESAMRMESLKKMDSGKDSIGIYYGTNAKIKYESDIEAWGEGLTTGYAILDDWFKFLPKQLYLITSQTHQGKTTLALNMAARIARENHHVFFFSLEQGLFIAPRIEGMVGGIPDTLGLAESDKLITAENLIEVVDGLKSKPELIVIDHLHFMKKDTKFGVTNAIDQMMIELQNACKRLGTPFLVIAHLRKLNEDRAPELDDVRDSSSLSQIPSVVMQIHRQKSESGVINEAGILYIRKNRLKGRTGSLSFTLKQDGVVELTERVRTENNLDQIAKKPSWKKKGFFNSYDDD